MEEVRRGSGQQAQVRFHTRWNPGPRQRNEIAGWLRHDAHRHKPLRASGQAKKREATQQRQCRQDRGHDHLRQMYPDEIHGQSYPCKLPGLICFKLLACKMLRQKACLTVAGRSATVRATGLTCRN